MRELVGQLFPNFPPGPLIRSLLISQALEQPALSASLFSPSISGS